MGGAHPASLKFSPDPPIGISTLMLASSRSAASNPTGNGLPAISLRPPGPTWKLGILFEGILTHRVPGLC